VAGRVEISCANTERPTAAELYEQVSGFPQEQYVAQFHYGATANVFTTAAVVRDVGPFNTDLRSGGDREWGERVHQAGYAQVYSAGAVVTHPARASLRELVRKRRRTTGGLVWHMRRSQGIYGRAHWTRMVVRVLRRRIVPPRPELAALWRDRRLTRTSERIKVVLVDCLMNYTYAVEFARVAFGGAPKR
jgi:hypothetical protein